MTRWDDLFDTPSETSPSPTLSVVTDPGNATSYAAAALRREAETVATTPNGQRNHTLNKAWFNMGRHVGAGNIDPRVVRATLAAAARQCGLPDDEIDTVLRDDATSALRAGQEIPRHPTPLPDLPTVTVLEQAEEDAFWDARPLLRHLHDFARARRVSPWAVLGVALARVITATPHQVCLPPIIGGRASVNLFVALVGRSGTGKGAAEAVAAEALPVGYITTHNTGSGEGIAHGYKRRVKGELEWLDDAHAVLFSVPEIDSLAAQGDRKGATLLPQLRSAWSGEQLGFGYADPTKRILIEAHQYRLCLVAGVQPARAGALLDDTDGGTPQRFLWLPATDHDAPEDAPAEPKPWAGWEAPHVSDLVTFGGVRIEVCDIARDTIVQAAKDRLRGVGEALDGHALLAQLKTAAALAIADGRLNVTDTDWALAEVIMRKSAATRAACQDALRAKAESANYARGEAEADRQIHVSEKVADAAIKRVCGVIARRLKNDEWVVRGQLRKALAARDRAYFEDAIDRLLAANRIELDDTAGAAEKYRLKEES